QPQAPDRLKHAELAVQLDRVAAKPHHGRRRVEHRDQPRRVARRSAGQVALLQQKDVVPAGPRKVVRDAAAGDAAADDNDAGPFQTLAPSHQNDREAERSPLRLTLLLLDDPRKDRHTATGSPWSGGTTTVYSRFRWTARK